MNIIEKQPLDNEVQIDDRINDVDTLPEGCSPCAWVIGGILFPLTIFSFYTIEPKEEAVITSCGNFVGVVSEPGCHWYNCFGREIYKVSTKRKTIDLANTKVVDLVGRPIEVSAVVTYEVIDSKRALLAIESVDSYIRQQASAILKRTLSQFHYENTDPEIPDLRSETAHVTNIMIRNLQERCVVAGVKICTMDLNELNYAPEIAASMLKRQQAHALVEAREHIVKGATEIAWNAIKDFESKGLKMSDEEKAKLCGNIVLVTVSDTDTVPTINLGN